MTVGCIWHKRVYAHAISA